MPPPRRRILLLLSAFAIAVVVIAIGYPVYRDLSWRKSRQEIAQAARAFPPEGELCLSMHFPRLSGAELARVEERVASLQARYREKYFGSIAGRGAIGLHGKIRAEAFSFRLLWSADVQLWDDAAASLRLVAYAPDLDAREVQSVFQDWKSEICAEFGSLPEAEVAILSSTRQKTAAEPGATDNPDDAQRLREDH